jgi:hypothetical protein
MRLHGVHPANFHARRTHAPQQSRSLDHLIHAAESESKLRFLADSECRCPKMPSLRASMMPLYAPRARIGADDLPSEAKPRRILRTRRTPPDEPMMKRRARVVGAPVFCASVRFIAQGRHRRICNSVAVTDLPRPASIFQVRADPGRPRNRHPLLGDSLRQRCLTENCGKGGGIPGRDSARTAQQRRCAVASAACPPGTREGEGRAISRRSHNASWSRGDRRRRSPRSPNPCRNIPLGRDRGPPFRRSSACCTRNADCPSQSW